MIFLCVQFRQRILREHGISVILLSQPHGLDEKSIMPSESREKGTDRSLVDPVQVVVNYGTIQHGLTVHTQLALAVARAKADAFMGILKNEGHTEPSLLITCDQVVHYENRIREKPESKEECRRYLQSYDLDHPAVTCSAVVITHTGTGRQVGDVDIAKQYFKPIPEEVMNQLIEKGDVMHCAGGFMIDDPLVEPYLDKRIGDEDSIIGMPIQLLKRLLAEMEQQSS